MNKKSNYSMVVAQDPHGIVKNAFCSEYEPLDLAFTRLAATHKIESWDGWLLSAWPRSQRVEVRQDADGVYHDIGPRRNQECYGCADQTQLNWRTTCARCYEEEVK